MSEVEVKCDQSEFPVEQQGRFGNQHLIRALWQERRKLSLAKHPTMQLPPGDQRLHKYIQLENGIEAILIQDDACRVAAISMDVGVGHMEDPSDLPGCAHLW